MASGQTANYGLNQWEGQDDFLRTEFNADNEKIDTALAGVQQHATNLTEAEHTAMTQAVEGERTARVQAVEGERDARIQAVSGEHTAMEQAVAAERNERIQAVNGERTAMNQAVTAERNERTQAVNTINGTLGTLSTTLAGKTAVVIGTYVGTSMGNQAASQIIHLGFTPTAVVAAKLAAATMGHVGIGILGGVEGGVTILENGFRVLQSSNFYLNSDSDNYGYIAFR